MFGIKIWSDFEMKTCQMVAKLVKIMLVSGYYILLSDFTATEAY